MLRSHDLAWIEDSANVLVITTADVDKDVCDVESLRRSKVRRARGRTLGTIHKPADSRAAGSPATGAGCGCQNADSGPWDSLKQVILSTVTPASWDNNGGTGTLSIFDGDLIVSQTDEIQSQVDDCLKVLEVARQQDPAALKAGCGTVIRSSSSSSPDERILTLFPGKDFGHEIEIPAATAAFHGDAVLAGMLLQ